MEIEYIEKYLLENSTKKLSDFSSALIPNAKPILGVKIPLLRKLAKEIAKDDYRTFLENCPDDYFEQLQLQGFVIGYAKDDIETILAYAQAFTPKIKDWSVNDSFCQTFTIARKHRERVWEWILKYAALQDEFAQRIAAILAMSHFMTEEYIDKVLSLMNVLSFDAYYTKMGVAWCVATAYAKFPKQTKEFMKNNQLDDWTYNKAIQKMIESYRVPVDEKDSLRRMKRSKIVERYSDLG